MRLFKYITAATLALINGAVVDYTQNGRNWPDTHAGCKASNQSPIDLSTKAIKVDSNKKEKFFKFYQDVKDTKVTWLNDYSTIQTSVDANAGKAVNRRLNQNSYFTSKFGVFDFGTPEYFEALQFHLHHKSEHTIDGQQFDLEMHTVHYPQYGTGRNGFIAAALGIIFDTKNYDRSVTSKEIAVIDAFFDSLQMDKNDPTPSRILYGKLITHLDTMNRFVYKGSVTTPPCARTVYWNVLRKVYPIKQRHLTQYYNQLARQTGQKIQETGNFRVTSPTTTAHKLRILTTKMTDQTDLKNAEYDEISADLKKSQDENEDKKTTIMWLVIFMIVFIITTIVFLACWLMTKYPRKDKKKEDFDGVADTERKETELNEKK